MGDLKYLGRNVVLSRMLSMKIHTDQVSGVSCKKPRDFTHFLNASNGHKSRSEKRKQVPQGEASGKWPGFGRLPLPIYTLTFSPIS